jgi:hypothetical protein
VCACVRACVRVRASCVRVRASCVRVRASCVYVSVRVDSEFRVLYHFT